ncbi:ketopantoate reductase PanE/ApbA-domain-containing protein [Boletus reticuloceps]|uniref:Ketopantoate reductase PanE/ApbA-domain-containing protein n=1 Tax=Boletus reticuloceps TaxID=495285 RepID=A0A8I2YWZ7_9AGAM|nr:ketopantoate reductase PanE/ApbA-domain-containing protein [Boletus reticuloceps]
MSAPTKEVLVVGFGAVGSIYSHILKRSGLARVTVVARSNYDAVREHGMDIQSKKYGNIPAWRPDRLVKSVTEAADRQYSYVVLTTKALPEIAKTPSHVQPTYVLMQNGLGVERDLYVTIKDLAQGDPKIISTVVWIGSNLTGKNQVMHNHFDRVTLGMYRHGDCLTTSNREEESAILRDFGGMLESGGTELTIVPEIQRHKFAKTFWNIAFSSFSTLTNSTLPAIFRPPPPEGMDGHVRSYKPYVAPITERLVREETLPVLQLILEEMVALGRAMGWPDEEDGLPSQLASATISRTAALHRSPESAHIPSMLLDYRNASPIEVEVIFGEVVRMARERSVPVPRIETLYALLTVIQNQILGGFKSPTSS